MFLFINTIRYLSETVKNETPMLLLSPLRAASTLIHLLLLAVIMLEALPFILLGYTHYEGITENQ